MGPCTHWSILIGILKVTSMNQHDQMLYVSPHRDFLFCPSLSLMQAWLVDDNTALWMIILVIFWPGPQELGEDIQFDLHIFLDGVET